jgi:predicted ATPase
VGSDTDEVTMLERLQFRHIRVRGYRALENIDISLGPLNVIIGPNGVGKSSLLDVFGFFSEALGRRESLARLLSRRGGIGRLLTLGRRESIKVEFVTQSLATRANPEHGPLRYEVELAATGIGYAIANERLTQERGKKQPFYFVNREEQFVKVYDPIHKRLVTPKPLIPMDELGLAQVPRALREAEWFRTAFEDIHLHDAIPTGRDAPVRRAQTLEPTNMVVAPEAQNLFSVLYQIRLEQPDWFERILDALRSAFPGFDRLEFPVVAGGQVILAWYHDAYQGRPFFANELSAGTLRFLHLVTLLLTPKSPTLILIDEPEDSLHPELVRLVAQLLLEAAERTQLIVATQSASLLQWLKPEHVIVADAKEGACTLTSGADLILRDWLVDYTLDSLWQMGNLGGRP